MSGPFGTNIPRMTGSLGMIIPTRGRPESVARTVEAWNDTAAPLAADLVWVVDLDDPRHAEYVAEINRAQANHPEWGLLRIDMERWMPMVPKLNAAAKSLLGIYPILGFMGDDHLPRSAAWVESIVKYLQASPPGQIVYGRDGIQDEKLATWWAMTADVVGALGRMVPADVQHLYCDNAIMKLGAAAKCITYLPHVYIEHMHPVSGKVPWDAGHRRANRPEQYDRDEAAYLAWVKHGLARDARLLRDLRGS